MAQLTGTTVLFSEDWSTTGSTPTQLDASNWDYTHWTAQNNASWLGQTQMIQQLPYAYNGAAHFTVETWLSGNAFSGQDAFTTAQYNLNTHGGLAFTGTFKLDAPVGGVGTDRLHIPTTPNATSIQGGLIAGFFTYQFFQPGRGNPNHDELDIEYLTTETQRVSTNVFTQSSGKDSPSSKPEAPSTFSSDTFNSWHTYRIEWLPNMVKWYMDGNLIRTETNPTFLPNPAINQQLHLDLWGVPSNWPKNPGDPTGPNVGDPSFVPATTAAANKVYDFQVQSVKIEKLSTLTGDGSANSITGGAGNDAISAQGGNDVVAGGAGDDTIFGGSGNDAIDGGPGNDTAVVVQAAKNVAVTANAGSAIVTVLDKVGTEGTDTLTSIETIQFNDQAIDASSLVQAASLSAARMLSVVELYTAGLNRAPDAVGLDYWAGKLASGMGLSDISKVFFASSEAAAIYGSPSSEQVFVSRAYNNVLGRDPDAAGSNYWVNQLQTGQLQRSDFVTTLIAGARGPGGNAADAQYIANKEAVGAHFALTAGLNNTAWAKTVEAGVNGTAASVTSANAQTDAFAVTAATPATSELVVNILGLVP